MLYITCSFLQSLCNMIKKNMQRHCANYKEKIPDQFHADKTLPNSRGRCVPWQSVTLEKGKKNIYVTLTNLIGFGSCWTGSISIVSSANEAQPCQLSLYIVLINEQRNRVHLDESACFFWISENNIIHSNSRHSAASL